MPMAASPSASAAATISPGWEPPRRKEKLVVTASSAYAVMELTLVGWAKALALPLCILSFSCAVPTTFGHRAEIQMVGTAYDRNRRAEQPCQRLCPPYKIRQLTPPPAPALAPSVATPVAPIRERTNPGCVGKARSASPLPCCRRSMRPQRYRQASA